MAFLVDVQLPTVEKNVGASPPRNSEKFAAPKLRLSRNPKTVYAWMFHTQNQCKAGEVEHRQLDVGEVEERHQGFREGNAATPQIVLGCAQ